MSEGQVRGLWAPQRRALTAGLVLTITFVASEALAVVTVMPVVARDLGGLRLYGWVFSGFMLGSVIGIGGMAGAIGGVLFQLATGYIVGLTHSYVPLFVTACLAYPLALIIINSISPKLVPAQID